MARRYDFFGNIIGNIQIRMYVLSGHLFRVRMKMSKFARLLSKLMKRITLIILAVAAIVASSVSCQKVNYIDVLPDAPDNSLLPEGALPGVFTVADPDGIPNTGDETKVHFSKGNLKGNIEWLFFDHQYECSLDGDFGYSLFAWGGH